MHIYYKFGLYLLFLLSISSCYTRAAPTAANQSSTQADDHTERDYDYDADYYDEVENETALVDKVIPVSTTSRPLFPLLSSFFDIPKRINEVFMEGPSCPKACSCLEDSTYLKCSNAGLKQVPTDIPKTARKIDLSYNFITHLEAQAFGNASKLQEIDLSENLIETIDKELFNNLPRLKRLILSNNKLNEVHPDTFAAAEQLEWLDLSNNSIPLNDNGESFLNQPQLIQFICKNCSWTQLYDDTFTNMSNLQTLRLDKNDFDGKINTKAFTPLKNLIKLRLPELDRDSIQELCSLLKSIDNISFKNFDISCFELVLGTSFNESLIPVTEAAAPKLTTLPTKAAAASGAPAASNSAQAATVNKKKAVKPISSNMNASNTTDAILAAGILQGDNSSSDAGKAAAEGEEKAYQVPVSPEAINYMLISVFIVAIIGVIIGVICRKDVGGIKTRCCRTSKPDPKNPIEPPAEEIPLNKI